MKAKLRLTDSKGKTIEINIPNINDFCDGTGMIQLSSGEYVLLEKDEPNPEGNDWVYNVKIIKNETKNN